MGQCPHELYERELPSPIRRRHLDLVLPSIQSTLYKALQLNEHASWSAYLRQRVADRGWNPGAFARGLRRPMKGLTQLQRWHLFRIHVNGHMSSARLHAARQAPVLLPCALCGRADDSARHILRCPTVTAAFRLVEGALPPHIHAPATWSQLFFPSDLDPALYYLTTVYGSFQCGVGLSGSSSSWGVGYAPLRVYCACPQPPVAALRQLVHGQREANRSDSGSTSPPPRVGPIPLRRSLCRGPPGRHGRRLGGGLVGSRCAFDHGTNGGGIRLVPGPIFQ